MIRSMFLSKFKGNKLTIKHADGFLVSHDYLNEKKKKYFRYRLSNLATFIDLTQSIRYSMCISCKSAKNLMAVFSLMSEERKIK